MIGELQRGLIPLRQDLRPDRAERLDLRLIDEGHYGYALLSQDSEDSVIGFDCGVLRLRRREGVARHVRQIVESQGDIVRRDLCLCRS
ncbi:hypothetical protein AA102526_2041 [Asaia lannensis NBRC 102526]|nr:hypothetical protein AA102526_2041 [Asaia lannensis NBRC 102526]